MYANGKLLGGCDATKALIASGQFDTLLGGGRQGGANGKNANGKAANSAALQVRRALRCIPGGWAALCYAALPV